MRAAADLAAESLSHAGDGLVAPPLLLETGVGAGNTLGGSLEEIAALLAELPSEHGGPAYGLCMDTAHVFASGYPVHHAEGLEQVVGELTDLGLLPRLGLVHLNDSASSFGSRRDLHENPGAGQIGYDGLAGVVRHPAFAGVPFVLETPGLEGHGPDAANLAVVKAMRAGLPAAAALAAAKDAHEERPNRGG